MFEIQLINFTICNNAFTMIGGGECSQFSSDDLLWDKDFPTYHRGDIMTNERSICAHVWMGMSGMHMAMSYMRAVVTMV